MKNDKKIARPLEKIERLCWAIVIGVTVPIALGMVIGAAYLTYRLIHGDLGL